MNNAAAKTFSATENSISQITEFVSDSLHKSKLNKNLAYEYELLVEEITVKLINCAKENAEISIDVYAKFGSPGIKITCPGKAVILEQEDEFDYGGKIIEEYSDYLKQDYSAGVNHITFSSSTTESNSFLLNCGISAVLSIVTMLLLHVIFDPQQLHWISENIVGPVLEIFTKCLQTVATPVAFFSLAAFLISLKLTLENNRKVIFLVFRYASTSIIALVIGIAIWQIYKNFGILFDLDLYRVENNNILGESIGEFINQSVLSNLIDPFLSSNPIPMLVMGMLIGIAAGNFFGPYGEMARNGILTFNGLFCKMMDIIYNSIPFFFYFALLRGWMSYGIQHALSLLETIAIFLPGFVLLSILYVIELLACGINPIQFLKDYKGVLWENIKIGSNLQALPYNKRMIARITKMPRDILEKGLTLGGMMNMDGNCIVISMGIIGMMISLDIKLGVLETVLMAFVIILLSIGAPNQPGSFILSISVLMAFAGISSTASGDFLIIEALYGKIYSSYNAFGDIVTMAIEGEKYKRQSK